MRIDVPKIVQAIDLAEYAPELSGVKVYVHLNPPRNLLTRYFELVGGIDGARSDPAKLDEIGRGLAECFAVLWSQHADPATHWTAEGVLELVQSDTDPALYSWLTTATIRLISEHRTAVKKNYRSSDRRSPDGADAVSAAYRHIHGAGHQSPFGGDYSALGSRGTAQHYLRFVQ